MNGPQIVRAPGKLFLVGEYAVLDGAPAVVAAVDRAIRFHVRPADDSRVHAVASVIREPLHFPVGAPPLVAGPWRFVLAAYRCVLDRFPMLARRGLRIEIESDLQRGGVKLGFGSSAAVTVAATVAFCAAADVDPPRDTLLAIALEAHRQGQGGRGSGGDVAAALHGGLVRYAVAAEGPPVVRRLPIPPALRLLVGWSGRAVASTEMVGRYRALAADPSSTRGRFLAAASRIVDEVVEALDADDVAAVAMGMGRYGELLQSLGRETGIPIVPESLARALDVARRCGAVAKTSGAGGGDCIVALADDEDVRRRVEERWREHGIEPLRLDPSTTGVGIDAERE